MQQANIKVYHCGVLTEDKIKIIVKDNTQSATIKNTNLVPTANKCGDIERSKIYEAPIAALYN